MVPHQHVQTFCALVEVSRLLFLAVQSQMTRLGEGDYEPSPEVSVLYRLYELIRVGVCEETRTLTSTQMPALSPLLNQLPPMWKRRMVDAIVGEQSRQCYHGRITMPPAARITPLPLEARRGQQPRRMR